jgi:NADP-dependent 3-hydroxy acid dehydrogenase YdfG
LADHRISSGIGRALAEAALAPGDSVGPTARRVQQVADLANSERVYPVALDVTDVRQRRGAVEAVAGRSKN